jgi:hypothetical protein
MTTADVMLLVDMERAADMERPSGASVAELQARRELEAKLYREGLTLEQISTIVGRNIGTIHGDLKKLGVEMRKQGPPKGTQRTWGRKHSPPTPRPCARCGVVFTPHHALDVGKFCSKLCHNRANAEAQGHKKGEWRTCLLPSCGKSFWKYASQLELSRGDFCSPTCWGEYRWTPASGGESVKPLIKANAERGRFGGRARQVYSGRWAGKYGHLGGRPRGELSDAQVAEIKSLAGQGWGRRAIANRLLVSERLVRNVLGT